MKAIQKLFCLVFCLVFANGFSQTNKIINFPTNGNPFDGVAREKLQLVFSRAELLAMGFTAGSVIDTLCFNIVSRNSTLPYTIGISYYYTNPGFCYSSNFLAPVVIAGSTIFSGSVNMSAAGNYYVPPTGGYLKIPLSPAIVWSGVNNSLIIEMCLSTNAGQAADSTCLIQIPGCNYIIKVINPQSGTNACSMLTGPPNLTYLSGWRPEVFLCSCLPTATNFPDKKNTEIKIKNVFCNQSSVKIKFYSPDVSTYNLKIMDVAGRIIFEDDYLKASAGENTFDIHAVLNKGIYFIELIGESGKATEKFCFTSQ